MREWRYQDEGGVAVPYQEAAWPETFLGDLFLKCQRITTRHGRLLDIMLPGSPITFGGWVSKIRTVPVALLLAKPNLEVAGFSILWEREGEPPFRRASFGFVFFPEFWGSGRIRGLARLGVRLWHEQYEVDRLWGTTLACNSSARRFAEQLGFHEAARLPGWFVSPGGFRDAVVYQHDRWELKAWDQAAEATDLEQQPA